jgi:molybdenum cofactor guanylyltransferase
MGADKALLPLGRENLLHRALKTAAAICTNPVIVGSASRYGDFGAVVEDRVPSCGPLGGIHAALSVSRTDRSLILSVDTPLMTAEFVRWLAARSAGSDELAFVPQSKGRTQPLCAVYRRGMLRVIEQALAAGEYKVDRLFAQVATRYLCDEEIHAAGFDDEIFDNVNTPEEYERLKHRFAAGSLANAESFRQ